jgi:hypothetical protein
LSAQTSDVFSGVSALNAQEAIANIPSPPPAFSIGDFGFSAAGIGADYTNISPSTGPSSSQIGLTAGLITSPISPNFRLQADGGFHNLSETGYDNGSLWNVGIAAPWQPCTWRFGPTVAIQSFSWTGYSQKTWNYGGFAEWDASPLFTGELKGGGLSSTATSSYGGYSNTQTLSGIYIGAGARNYFTPDIYARASVDYFNYTGSNRTDFTLGGEWLVSHTFPLGVKLNYTLQEIPNNHQGLFNVGAQYYFNGPSATSLVDRQRDGLVTNYQFRF